MKDTGGQAFPRAYSLDDSCDYLNSIPAQEGMTLRDYFAGQVIPHVTQDFKSGEEFAEHVFMLADAMIKERNKDE